MAWKVAASVVTGRKKRRHFAGSGGGGGSVSRKSGPSTSGPGVTPGGVTFRVARGTTSRAGSSAAAEIGDDEGKGDRRRGKDKVRRRLGRRVTGSPR